MQDSLPEILNIIFESCSRRPLFIKVNSSEQVKFGG